MKTDKHGRKTPNQSALDKPAHRFWDHVDRDQMELALSSTPDKYDTFLTALHDVAYSRWTIPAIMKKFNISLHELQVLYTDHMRQLGLLKMSSELPQVMSDVADDAKNRQVLCPRCEGSKTVESTKNKQTVIKECPGCEGTGRVLMQGDKHARDLVFESMKLTKIPGGPLVAINQNIGGEGGLDSSMESMMKMTQQITVGNK